MQVVSEFSTEGSNYGEVQLKNNEIVMSSSVNSKSIIAVGLNGVTLCVVPATNRDEVEIQFEAEKAEKHDDGLVQMTLHFPPGEEEDGATKAEHFQKSVMNTGVIRSVTGNIIAEFSKEQGNFVTPRGKYSIQMTSTYMHMQGAQYAYKIKYDDINALFLLPKIDGGRMAFVISLEKPIRQGNQKYQNLVLETHKLEHTLSINLTEEEIESKYEGQLTAPTMTMPMSSLIAKVFKVLSQKKVFIPKQFLSARDAHCIRCSIKANDGLLYPLAKSFIFINKPCVIIKFEDIEYAEFKRYEPAANSATRNFDLVINVKEGSQQAGDNAKEYAFMSIDRSEYASLLDYLNSKEIKIKNPQEVGPAAAKGGAFDAEEDGVGAGSEEDSEEDGDYEGGHSSHSAASDDSGEDSDAGDQQEEKERKPEKKRKSSDESRKSGKSKAAAADEDKGAKKKRAKKDKNAPKGALGSYMYFSKEERSKVKAEQPTLSLTETSKVLGERWKALSVEEKKPYEDLAKIDKERFVREMAAYKSGGGVSADVGEDDDAAEDEE